MDDRFKEWVFRLDRLSDADVEIVACVLNGLLDWMGCKNTSQDKESFVRVAHVMAHIGEKLAAWSEQEQLNKN